MPYFLNDPASMATNSGACSRDMAGTDTLIVFSGVSAEKVGASGDTNKAAREIKIAHRFIVPRIFPTGLRPDYPKRVKMSSSVLKLSPSFFSDAESATAGGLLKAPRKFAVFLQKN